MHLLIAHVHVNGDATSRGHKISAQTKQQIAHLLETYQRTYSLCGISSDKTIERAVQLIDVIQVVSPVSMDELQGVDLMVARGRIESANSLALGQSANTGIFIPLHMKFCM